MQTDIFAFLEAAHQALEAGEELAKDMSVRLYAAASLVVDPGTNEMVTYGRWINLEAPEPDWMPGCDIEAIALGKLGMTLHHHTDTPPVTLLEGDLGWQGGVYGGRFQVGVSGADEKQDREVALLILRELANFYVPHPRVHHIGVRFASWASYNHAIALMQRGGFIPIEAPAVDHLRVYFDLGGLYLEFQTFPDQELPSDTHIDVITAQPLQYMAGIADEVTDWGEGEEPRGQVRLTSELRLMARSQDWTPGAK